MADCDEPAILFLQLAAQYDMFIRPLSSHRWMTTFFENLKRLLPLLASRSALGKTRGVLPAGFADRRCVIRHFHKLSRAILRGFARVIAISSSEAKRNTMLTNILQRPPKKTPRQNPLNRELYSFRLRPRAASRAKLARRLRSTTRGTIRIRVP
jgi:hypothetical protein